MQSNRYDLQLMEELNLLNSPEPNLINPNTNLNKRKVSAENLREELEKIYTNKAKQSKVFASPQVEEKVILKRDIKELPIEYNKVIEVPQMEDMTEQIHILKNKNKELEEQLAEELDKKELTFKDSKDYSLLPLKTDKGHSILEVMSSKTGRELLSLSIEIFNLELAITQRKKLSINHIMEHITLIFESIDTSNELFKQLIDNIITLNDLLIPHILHKDKALQIINIIKQKLIKKIDEMIFIRKEEKEKIEEIEESTDEEEVYWSDFSDEDYEQDDYEDTLAVKAIVELQKWIGSSHFVAEYVRRNFDRTGTGRISIKKFMRALSEIQCSCDIELLCAFIRRLEIDDKGSVNYEELIKNLNEKPIAWWTEYIHNNVFDQRNRVSRKGNIATLAWPHTYSFVKSVITIKILKKENRDNLIEDIIMNTKKESLTKSEFRKLFLYLK